MARILLAEDERITAALFERLLTRQGHEVVAIANTGPEAIQYASQYSPEFIFMDINLQQHSAGIDACKVIKKKDKKVKIYFVSAYDEFMFANELKNCPYNGYIDKYLFENKVQDILKL